MIQIQLTDYRRTVRHTRHAAIFLISLLLMGCNLTAPSPLPDTALTELPAPIPTLPNPPDTETDTTDESSDWQAIAPGLERRTFTPDGNLFGQFVAVRIDPALYDFRTHYLPGDARTISAWQAQLPDAAVIINSNFFDTSLTALGLLIADGVSFGQSFINRGGTFAIEHGRPLLRSNVTTPYQGEPFEQAVQAFPMLIENGQIIYRTAPSEPTSRRSAIGIDSAGRVIFIITPLFGLSLADLAAALNADELDLVHALNLDGGGSTMLAIPGVDYALPSLDPVPAVLAVYPAANFP